MERNVLTLSEYLEGVQHIITEFPRNIWVKAEVEKVKQTSAYCYIDLVEKSDKGFAAKTSAKIWSSKFAMLNQMFYDVTGSWIAEGMGILICVDSDFNPKFGYSLNIVDIDPTFTLGDMAKRRAETIQKLKDDGVWDMNHDLEFPMLPQRIAVISSKTAAGYGDFMNQLDSNTSKLKFYTCLFDTTMQGESCPNSVIYSLDRIFEQADKFDVVVIIRGGGATSDMLAFDNYDMASCCAQFPLPIISGIGHERDECIVDMVANTRCKTPTAVAAMLIEKMEEQLNYIEDMQLSIAQTANNMLDKSAVSLERIGEYVRTKAKERLTKEESKLSKALTLLTTIPRNTIKMEESVLLQLRSGIKSIAISNMRIAANSAEVRKQHIKTEAKNILAKEAAELANKKKLIEAYSPDSILKKGFTLTLLNGKAIKDATLLNEGDVIETITANGKIQSEVKKTTKKN